MNISFYDSGTSDGKSPVNYVLSKTDHKGDAREIEPDILVGDPADIINEIDSIDRKHKYKSFSINFRDDEIPSRTIKKKLIAEVMRALCSGLKDDQYKYLAVDHGQHIHIVMPMKELSTGRALNIKPPGETVHEYLWTLQGLFNHKYGWGQVCEKEPRGANPGMKRSEKKLISILKAQGIEAGKINSLEDVGSFLNRINLSDSGKAVIGRALTREFLHEKIVDACLKESIKTRKDLISFLGEKNFQFGRISKNSITLIIGEQRVKFSGGIYSDGADVLKTVKDAYAAENSSDTNKFDYHKNLAVFKRLYKSRSDYFKKAFAPSVPLDVAKRNRAIGMHARTLNRERRLKNSGQRNAIFLAKAAVLINSGKTIDIFHKSLYSSSNGEVSKNSESYVHFEPAPKLRDQSSPPRQVAQNVIPRINKIRVGSLDPPSVNSPNKNNPINPSNSGSSQVRTSSGGGFSGSIGALRQEIADLQSQLSLASFSEALKIKFKLFQIKNNLEGMIAREKKAQDEQAASSYSRPKGP